MTALRIALTMLILMALMSPVGLLVAALMPASQDEASIVWNAITWTALAANCLPRRAFYRVFRWVGL